MYTVRGGLSGLGGFLYMCCRQPGCWAHHLLTYLPTYLLLHSLVVALLLLTPSEGPFASVSLLYMLHPLLSTTSILYTPCPFVTQEACIGADFALPL